MKRTVLLAVFVTTLSYSSPTVAQEARGLSDAPRCEANVDQPPVPTPVPHVHRNVSLRRLALGALIGGAAGAAVGVSLARSSCGASASRQECVGYGQLGAVMGGVSGMVLGVHIAARRP